MITPENVKKGDIIFYIHKNKIKNGIITRINTYTVSFENKETRVKGRLGFPNAYLKKPVSTKNPIFPCPKLKRSTIHTQEDLNSLLKKTINLMSNVFNKIFTVQELNELNNATICWTNNMSYRTLGKYIHDYNNLNLNNIQISHVLKNCPKHVIKHVIYHELLHIRYQNHDRIFKHYEKMYPKIIKAQKYVDVLLYEIRYNGIIRLNALIPKIKSDKP